MEKETQKPAENQTTNAEVKESSVKVEKAAKPIKKVVETTKDEITADNKDEAKLRKPEEGVLIMACLNPVVAKAATDSAHSNNVEVVVLEDEVIFDYLKERGSKAGNRDNIANFLSNENNRRMAKEHQMKLWNILTCNAPIEIEINKKKELVFNRTHIVKATTMSHSQAADVMQLLNAFGYIQFEKDSKFRFKFVFDDNDIKQQFKDELDDVVKVLVASYLKYESVAGNDKDKIFDDFINELRLSIK